MPELLAHQDLPKHVPGEVIANSDGLGWKGVALRGYAYRGQDVEVPAMRDFMLVSYRTGVTPMQRRFDGRWTRTTCGPGAVSLLTRSQVSRWTWTEDVEVTHLYLSPELVSNVAADVAGREIEDISLADVLRADDPVIAYGVQLIEREAAAPGRGGELYADLLARQLAVHLLRTYAAIRLKARERAGRLTAAQRGRVLDYIEANLDRPLDLPELAAQAGMSPCTFSRHFRRTMGVAPYRHVQDRRLDRALTLLRDTAEPIKSIAAACGFSDQSHMTRQFARRYARTPAAFRKEAGEP